MISLLLILYQRQAFIQIIAIVASDYVMIPLQAEEESTNNIQNYISYLIDLQEQF